MATILYSADSSYYSMIARLILAEKEVDYQLKKVDIHIKMEQFAAEYLKIQPNMTVPTLVCDGQVISDSHKILFFVNENFLGEDLYPLSNQEKIKKLLNLHYSFSIEDLTMGKTMRQSPIARFALGRGLSRATRRCMELLKTHPEFKEPLERKLKLEDERRKLILSKENNYQEMYEQAVNLCNMLDTELNNHKFVAGDEYSLADVVWTVFIARLFMIKLDSLIVERKNLYAYWLVMIERKSYVKANLWTKMPFKVIVKLMFALIFLR